MVYVTSNLNGDYDLYNRLLQLIHFNKDDELYIIGNILGAKQGNHSLLKDALERENVHVITGPNEQKMCEYLETGYLNPKDYCLNDALAQFYNSATSDEFRNLCSSLRNLPTSADVKVHGQRCRLVPRYSSWSPEEQLANTCPCATMITLPYAYIIGDTDLSLEPSIEPSDCSRGVICVNLHMEEPIVIPY